ncbi:class I SAM-dependent methyltransferase [Candidatus Uhrbacteria bacterium]|nr:class I SAM-dependent methyltransferase [Candidatus Uhrbacteria bacterium]
MLQRERAQWDDYELLDSGGLEKCERFGSVVLVRPEPQALWEKANAGSLWKKAHARFVQEGAEGRWITARPLPEPWELRWNNLVFGLELTSFKHTGIFPEQAANWKYLESVLHPGSSVLNLFGYTGAASLVAAGCGAHVVHVDASKPSVTWGKENVKRSGLEGRQIRWIVDDAKKFVAREGRRGHRYHAILLDPPAFGRGPSGEVWKFERDLFLTLKECGKITAEHGHVLVNAYSLGFSAVIIEQVVKSALPFVRETETIELTLQESTPRAFVLPGGVTVRAVW